MRNKNCLHKNKDYCVLLLNIHIYIYIYFKHGQDKSRPLLCFEICENKRIDPYSN